MFSPGGAPEIAQQREVPEAVWDGPRELVSRQAEIRQRSNVAQARGNSAHQLVARQVQLPVGTEKRTNRANKRCTLKRAPLYRGWGFFDTNLLGPTNIGHISVSSSTW